LVHAFLLEKGIYQGFSKIDFYLENGGRRNKKNKNNREEVSVTPDI
jgi:hypothetical protein